MFAKKMGAAVFIALTTIACSQAEITQPPIPVTPKVASNASGLDVYAGPRSRGAQVPQFRGQEIVQIRTWGAVDGGARSEMIGVNCILDSGVYSAAFQTPANVLVPDYGPNSPALFVRCENGNTSGSITVNAVNKTAQERNASAAGTGLLGAIVIGAVNESRRNNDTDDFGYNPITVQLR
jgi:opacity protein-like surface antigen